MPLPPVMLLTDVEMLVMLLIAVLFVVLTPVESELTAIERDETELDIDPTVDDVLTDSDDHAVETELMPVDKLTEALFQAVDTELMPVERLDDALLHAVDREAMPVDIELMLVESDSDAELTAVESEFDTVKSWLPLIASVLPAVTAPPSRLVMLCPVMSRYWFIWMTELAFSFICPPPTDIQAVGVELSSAMKMPVKVEGRPTVEPQYELP